MEWAAQQPIDNSFHKFVLTILAKYFNDKEHKAWPSHALLARDVAATRQGVQNALRLLEEKYGLIEIGRVFDEGGRFTSNSYYLPDFDPLSTRPDGEELSEDHRSRQKAGGRSAAERRHQRVGPVFV